MKHISFITLIIISLINIDCSNQEKVKIRIFPCKPFLPNTISQLILPRSQQIMGEAVEH